MAKQAKQVWVLKERSNPQFKQSYYVKMGAMSVKEHNELTKSTAAYGSNYYRRFEDEAAYLIEIEKLLGAGCSVK